VVQAGVVRSPLPDYLTEVLAACSDDDEGELAAYIPELADADPDRLALALSTPSGTRYALALVDHGLEAVLERVGVEPSGDAFNEISLDPTTNRPLNPMINAGAITVHSMLDVDRVQAGFAAFAGRELEVDEEVYRSELDSADRNHAIAYMLRNHGIIDAKPTEVVDGYTRQCSLLVDVGDLSVMAATLANAGVHPITGDRVVPRWVARQVLSVMTTCGMYDAAGDWFTLIGIPAKSGVSGGVIGALPGKGGFAAFSPRLDAHGNSTRGVRVFERLSRDMGMHLMEVPPAARPLTHGHAAEDGDGDGDLDSTYELQGSVDFVGMEQLLVELEREDPGAREIVIDLGRVHEVRDVGRRMLLEAARRLGLDGHPVTFVDPEDMLEVGDAGSIDVGDGPDARVVREPDPDPER
jgi:glutaminase